MNKKQLQITEGVIWKQLLIFFFPIVMGTFFQQMYNTVDTIIVGRFVGTAALASVGTTAALISMTTGFFIGLSTGATVVLSQYFGAGDEKKVKDTIHTAMTLSLVLGVTITLLGLLAGPTILVWIRTPKSCMDGAVEYLRIYFLGSIASMFYNMGAGILRAMGDSKRPMIFLIVACFVNIILDLVFVVYLHMGIAGAALATILSQLACALMVVFVLVRLPKEIRLTPQDMKIRGNLLKSILMVGIPSGIEYMTYDLSNLLVQSGINSFGEATVAAWAANSKTDALIWMVIGAFGVSITTFVGQNYGARKFDRIKKSVMVCMGMGIAVVGGLTAVMLTLRVPILHIYIDDPQVIAIGAKALMLIAPFYWIFVPVEVMSGAMRGVGYSVVPTIITTICACVFRVVWVMFVVTCWHTMEVLAMAYPLSWILAAGVFCIVYFRGNWLRKASIQANPDTAE